MLQLQGIAHVKAIWGHIATLLHMRTNSRPLVLLLPLLLLHVLLLPEALRAELLRLPLDDDSSFLIKRTSLLKFFGNGPRNEIINASAVVLDGRTVCRPKQKQPKQQQERLWRMRRRSWLRVRTRWM